MLKSYLKYLIVLLIVPTLLFPGCSTAPDKPGPQLAEDTTLLVWDCIQPRFPGTESYTDQIQAIVEKFQETTGIEVTIETVERDTILSYLSSASREEGPDILFSTEWPLCPSWIKPISLNNSDEPYLDIAIEYWSQEETLKAIPSYIHWLCMALDATNMEDVDVKEDTEILSSIKGKIGYFMDSIAFMPSILGITSGCSGQEYADTLVFLKSNFGEYSEDPLSLWRSGAVKALFPVTPHLFKWLRLSDQQRFVAMTGVFAQEMWGRFLYTVPSYIVNVEEDGPKRDIAISLAKELSSALGKWAARSVGGIPVLVSDLPVFQVESGFSPEERSWLLSGLQAAIPLNSPGQSQENYEHNTTSLVQITLDFLSGRIDEEKMRQRISEALSTHTNP
jgi:hypothetical protein